LLKFTYLDVRRKANYSCKTFSPKVYPLARLHSLKMTTTADIQTDERQPCRKVDRYLSTVG